MRNLILITVFCLFQVNIGYSQLQETDQAAKSEIIKLSFIVGNWNGTGWMMGQDRNKHDFTQTENIQFKLDSTAILIEGLGNSNGKEVHNALAIITYNKEENNYNFQSFLSTGKSGKFKGELIDNRFYWYPKENIRFTIYLNENGQWYETGEMNREGKWYQFFEMTLQKV